MADCLWTRKESRQLSTKPLSYVNLALYPAGENKSSTGLFGWSLQVADNNVLLTISTTTAAAATTTITSTTTTTGLIPVPVVVSSGGSAVHVVVSAALQRPQFFTRVTQMLEH